MARRLEIDAVFFFGVSDRFDAVEDIATGVWALADVSTFWLGQLVHSLVEPDQLFSGLSHIPRLASTTHS
jgi:hypothetical protein